MRLRSVGIVVAVLASSGQGAGSGAAPGAGPGGAATMPGRVMDVVYQTDEAGEKADVYLAKGAAAGGAPAVIWMHGNHHDKGDAREKEVCTELSEAGYVAISVNYGSWPETDEGEEQSPRIAQNIANARNAVRFFRAHAGEYGIDPKRIAMFGGSAGGWLSLMVGLTNGDEGFDGKGALAGVSSGVYAIGDFYGDTDGWLKSRITGKSPPVLMVYGKADTEVDYHEGEELEGLLGKAGVKRELKLLEGVGHSFDFRTWQGKPLPEDLGPVAVAFMKGAEGGDVLAHLRAGHPRLLLTAEGLAAVKADGDPLRAELTKHVIATAEGILKAPAIRKPDNAGSQEQDRYAVYNIVTCAMAWRLTGDERFLRRAKGDLLTVAGFEDWDPQHFLSVGEMSFAAAIGYDWLYDQLSAEERAAVKKGIMQNGLVWADGTYGLPTDKKVMWSAKNVNNWNQVCNGGLVSAALAVADEEPAVARRVIEGARVSMAKGLESYGPDGGFPEGPGYWTYGTTYAAIAFGEMETALGTDFGLSESDGFKKTLGYYEAMEGPTERMFNYADSTDDLQVSPARAWLAKRFDSGFALGHARELLGEVMGKEAVMPFDRVVQGTVVNRFFALHEVWFPQAVTGAVTMPALDAHFRGVADVATFRSAWGDKDALFVGFKAGENVEHHNHLDLGSFVMDADGVRWAMDLGPDDYEVPGYGDYRGVRWKVYRVSNMGHGTVTVGEELQKLHVAAAIEKFGSTAERGFAVADMSGVYEGMKGLKRGVEVLDRSRVVVEDEYEAGDQKLPLHWRMITGAKIEVSADGRTAELTSGGKKLRAEVLSPAGVKFEVESTKPGTGRENQNEGTRILGMEVGAPADGGMVRMVVVLTPEGEKWGKRDAPAVVGLEEWK